MGERCANAAFVPRSNGECGISILDTVKQMISSETPATTTPTPDSPILGHVMDLVNNPESGGLQGMMAKFQSNGLGDLMNSWMGTGGSGRGITADEISRVIGSDKLGAMATKLGIEPDEVSNLVAKHLPDVISKLSPATRLEQG
jgi:uncharacterized protein YidB (DUF937 family)